MFTNEDLKSILHNNNTQQISNVLPQWFNVTAKRLKGGMGNCLAPMLLFSIL